jgi:hypothetical protein
VKERSDIDPMRFYREPDVSPPPGVAADPGRLAYWNETVGQPERRKEADRLRSLTVFEVHTCQQDGLVGCWATRKTHTVRCDQLSTFR